jgi:hypothetical protein
LCDWGGCLKLLQCTSSRSCKSSLSRHRQRIILFSRLVGYRDLCPWVIAARGRIQCVLDHRDYDLFTEYKRGFPTFKASNTSLRLIVFPDTHFGIAPLRQSIVPSDERASTACSKQILDLVPQCEVQDLPIPRLPNLFTGLCSRFFESGNLMARIAVEQLVDGMNLDDDWIESNLGGATIKVRNLAAQLVLEKGFRHEEDMALGAMHSDFDAIRMQDLSSIPGSGF